MFNGIIYNSGTVQKITKNTNVEITIKASEEQYQSISSKIKGKNP